MGTRSLTFVTEDHETPIICMYRQMDGYPEGMGKDLFEFLDGLVVTNGIGLGDGRRTANGAGCLAAQLVARFKRGAGGIYLHTPKKFMDCGQEYEYVVNVSFDTRQIDVSVYNKPYDGRRKTLFTGSVEDYGIWLALHTKEVA